MQVHSYRHTTEPAGRRTASCGWLSQLTAHHIGHATPAAAEVAQRCASWCWREMPPTPCMRCQTLPALGKCCKRVANEGQLRVEGRGSIEAAWLAPPSAGGEGASWCRPVPTGPSLGPADSGKSAGTTLTQCTCLECCLVAGSRHQLTHCLVHQCSAQICVTLHSHQMPTSHWPIKDCRPTAIVGELPVGQCLVPVWPCLKAYGYRTVTR